MKKRLAIFLSWSLVVLCMIVIFNFSSQKSEISSETSGRTLKIVMTIINPLIKDLPDSEQFNIKEGIHVFIRKTAHMTIYMILAFLTSNAVYNQNYFCSNKIGKDNFAALNKAEKRKIYKNSVISLLITVLYAVSDEFHQLFVDGRSCEFRDVMIDSAGALIGILIYLLIFRIIVNKHVISNKKHA